MKKTKQLTTSNTFSPNLNLRSRKIIRQPTEVLNNFGADLAISLPLVEVPQDEPIFYELCNEFDFDFWCVRS
ncbi:hypothetical protein BpHYR1_047012 [Brachionus plicatilis]|uniref:Uncharacterized protein n=1 Tax=Brachionus plicatilis TaxID=10195 RepID=A0A3M7QB10_BRAPC|nr:hypothetical protein BpHYR1_047012 [Brachionus plicatilis]